MSFKTYNMSNIQHIFNKMSINISMSGTNESLSNKFADIYGSLYSLYSIFLPHLFCTDVGVTTSTVPVALHWFGVQCRNDPKIFTDTMQDEACNPKMVAHLNALAGTHLELPLILETAKEGYSNKSEGKGQIKFGQRMM